MFGFIANKSSSRRVPLLLGLLPLSAATVIIYIGSSTSLLVAGRILQGAAAAMVWTVGVSLLVESVDPDHLGQALGYVSMAITAATLIGPLLGGVIYNRVGYGAVFAMAFALIVLDLFLRSVMIEKKTARKWTNTCGRQSYGTMSDSQSIQADRPFVSRIGQPKSVLTSEAESDAALSSNSSRTLDATVREIQPKPASLCKKRLAPAQRLLISPPIIVCLLGCFVQACLMTTFDAVSIFFLGAYR